MHPAGRFFAPRRPPAPHSTIDGVSPATAPVSEPTTPPEPSCPPAPHRPAAAKGFAGPRRGRPFPTAADPPREGATRPRPGGTPMQQDAQTNGPPAAPATPARIQKEHFESADPRCRSLELPEGLLLRYAAARSLYFYLRSGVQDGSITTAVYASDSPYDRQKALIGAVATPMFQGEADLEHLRRVEALVRSWVEFVKDPDAGEDFRSFPLQDRRG